MTLSQILTLFTPLDFIALAMIFLCWQGSGLLIDNPPKKYPSVSFLMSRFRRLWMQEFVTREPRIFDSQIISSLRDGTSFFASATMIAIGGGLALIGNADLLQDVAQDLTQETPPKIVWEIKLIATLIIVTNGFLKFVWAHRLFGYCSILMAAVPNDPKSPRAIPRANKAAEINISAARAYNRGLRAIYFGIASTAWLLADWALIAATLFTFLVVLRREFASVSRKVLLRHTDEGSHTET